MKKLLVLFGLILIGFIGFLVWWKNGAGPVNSADTTQKVFVIVPGAPIRGIGNDLKEQGLIRDPVIFFLHVKKNNLDKKIQAGDYKLSPTMNLAEVIEQLTTGRMDVWVQVKEGVRAEEIAEILEEQLPNFDESWISVLKENEGYLFPDTYLVPAQADVAMIISIMRGNFDTKTAEVGIIPTPQIVTLASLIERESRGNEEKPTIAGILTNRIRDGIPLQVDATIQYGKGNKNRWWPIIEVSDYQGFQSTYNTYLITGLPPGPISNPGIESLKAAANPASTPYYYYIHEPDGLVHYAKTVSEHNNNVNKYLR